VPAVAVLLVEEEEAEEKKEVGGVKLMIGEDGVDVKPRVGEDGDGKVGEEVIDVEPRFGEDGDSKVGEEVKPRVGEDGDRKEGEEVMDVKPRVGEDGEGKEGDEVVDVKPRIGGDGDGKEGEEAEVLEDIGEVLEVESVIDGAEDVGESDEVGEEVKAADVAGTPGIEIVKLKLSHMLKSAMGNHDIVGGGIEIVILRYLTCWRMSWSCSCLNRCSLGILSSRNKESEIV
ncbi:MAG: hypothetical protein Q9200_003818, partial [Gallowayella weberi]